MNKNIVVDPPIGYRVVEVMRHPLTTDWTIRSPYTKTYIELDNNLISSRATHPKRYQSIRKCAGLLSERCDCGYYSLSEPKIVLGSSPDQEVLLPYIIMLECYLYGTVVKHEGYTARTELYSGEIIIGRVPAYYRSEYFQVVSVYHSPILSNASRNGVRELFSRIPVIERELEFAHRKIG